MGEKPGKVQALVVEFSADCAAIRAKSGEGCYSEAVVSSIFLEKGCLYLPILPRYTIRTLYGQAGVMTENPIEMVIFVKFQ